MNRSKDSMTTLQQHFQKWGKCTACPLHEGRHSVVLCRGTVPCDILFIGEAPGASEDSLGEPFVGPAGHLLNQMIDQSQIVSGGFSYALTNLVACIPLGEDGNKTAEPDRECVNACAPRLLEFIRLCRPRGIILVGKLAAKHCAAFSHAAAGADEWLGDSLLEFQDIIHPAAILRRPDQRNYAMRRNVVQINEMVYRLTSPDKPARDLAVRNQPEPEDEIPF